MFDRRNSIHLFRLFGIDVYLNWLWLLAVGYFIYQYVHNGGGEWYWGLLLCLSLYLIVLIHEFGHQLACRQVGGKTRDIMLWPFGGVAFVTPPERPGAQLWSIAAGPLVNAVLIPVFYGLLVLFFHLGWETSHPQTLEFVADVAMVNLLLLKFNLLPIYPLDGGQIVRSLLWFVIGRARSLLVTSIIGFIGVGCLLLYAGWELVMQQDTSGGLWLAMISVFILMNCWGGLKMALLLGRLAKIPRRGGYACPDCHNSPPAGNYWRCNHCGVTFDLFLTAGVCPGCQKQFQRSNCLDCGTLHSLPEWMVPPPA